MVNQRHQAQPHRADTTRRLAVGGMTAAALGIYVQRAGGADYPVVPPGVVVLLAGAALLALRRRWAPPLGALIAVFISFGGIVTPKMRDQLGAASKVTAFSGTVIELVGLVLGLVCGVAVAVRAVRGRRPA
ncbi:hypothetical protein OG896_28215 [Streptomyces sp. NBC_00669]|uniref:hypothetical protein n=1 Tax=unclassified Streptomyces TaxID=2593676 RepID=UPI002E3635AA|nr:hypothetical protein [Streptomyces sp. NBC_00669]